MRKLALLLAGIGALILTACTGNNVASPLITISGMYVNEGIITSTDKLYVGDTLKMNMVLDPFYDRLVYFKVNINHDYLIDSTFTEKDINEICDKTKTDKEKGEYYFAEDKMPYGAYLTMKDARIIVKATPPESEKNTTLVEFELKSTANVKPEYNPTYSRFYIKVIGEKRPE